MTTCRSDLMMFETKTLKTCNKNTRWKKMGSVNNTQLHSIVEPLLFYCRWLHVTKSCDFLDKHSTECHIQPHHVQKAMCDIDVSYCVGLFTINLDKYKKALSNGFVLLFIYFIIWVCVYDTRILRVLDICLAN